MWKKKQNFETNAVNGYHTQLGTSFHTHQIYTSTEKVIPKTNFIQIQKSHKNFKKLSKTVNIVPHNLKNLFTKIFENNLFEFSVNV